jgi:restriction system protein
VELIKEKPERFMVPICVAVFFAITTYTSNARGGNSIADNIILGLLILTLITLGVTGLLSVASSGFSVDEVNFDEMDGYEFEAFCAQLLKSNGFSEVTVTQGSGDYGVDILAKKKGRAYAFQCKRSESNIGVSAVQEVLSGKLFYKCDIGIVLTNQYFTKNAIKAAKETGITLWDRSHLDRLICEGQDMS